MAGENERVIRGMYEAYLAGDTERALTYFHPDVVVDFTVRGDIGVQRGRMALDDIVGVWKSTWDDYREEIDELRDIGDGILVVAMMHGRGRGSGVEVRQQWAWIYEVEDGLITRITAYLSRDAALAAASSETDRI